VLREAFHREHERLYGFRDPQAPVEVSTIRLAIVGRLAKAPSAPCAPGSGRPVPRARRQVYLRGSWQDTGVYDRIALGAGDLLDGPAVIEQEDTTIVLLPGWQGRTDVHGNLHLKPVDGQGEAA